MNVTVFLCAECEIVITKPLRCLEEVTLLRTEISHNDYEQPPQLIPVGFYFLSDVLLIAGFVVNGFAAISPGDVMLNAGDLLNQHPTLMNEQDIGCCGLCGVEGYNWFCINGHAIGTEVSECAVDNYCCFPLTNVLGKEVFEQSALR